MSRSKLSTGEIYYLLQGKLNDHSNLICSFRCFLSEIGPVHRAAVGDGGTAAVIVRDGVNLGLLYIE